MMVKDWGRWTINITNIINMLNTINNKSYIKLHKELTILNKVKGYKTGQGKFYPKAVQEFLWWLEQKGIYNIEVVTTKLLMEYYEYLQTRPNQRRGGTLSDISIKHHLFGIKLLMDYLVDSGYKLSISHIPTHFSTRAERPVLTVDEVKELYDNVENKIELAILSLAYGCGLRRTELVNLQTSDISLTKGYLVVRKGKNGKRREVPLSDKVASDLTKYLTYERTRRLNPRNSTKAMLISTKGTPLTGGTINELFKDLVKRCSSTIQNKAPTLHTLRHSIATHLAEQGAGVEFIQSFLGHIIMDTSQLYIIRRKRTKNFKL